MKTAGEGISDRLRGVGRGCIHDQRFTYLSRCDRRVRYIEIGRVTVDGRRDCGRSDGATSIWTVSATPERRDRDPRTYDVI